MTSTYSRTFGTLICGILFLIIAEGCENERIYLKINQELDIINANDEQTPKLTELLTKINSVLENFYDKTGQPYPIIRYTSRIPFPSTMETVQEEIRLLENIRPLMSDIFEMLTGKQRRYWRQTELFELFQVTRTNVMKFYSEFIKLPYRRDVTPGRTMKPGNGLFEEIPVEPWTVYFGNPFVPDINEESRYSMNMPKTMTYPISVQATLMDRTLLSNEEFAGDIPSQPSHDISLIEIRILVTTHLSEQDVNLDNWIVYLETSDEDQIEPISIVKRDYDWFANKGMILVTGLPSLFMPIEPYAYEYLNEYEGLFETQFERSEGYYQVFFPAHYDNIPLITPENKFLKLVFSERMGSEVTAQGIWNLKY